MNRKPGTTMNRRGFLLSAAGVFEASKPGLALPPASTAQEVSVKLDPTRTLATIPPDFMGLGYEISSVARPGLLSATNSVYVQLVRTLGARGVIRIGGNTADYASFSANAAPLSSPENKAGSIVNEAVLRDLGSFLDATGWSLIWALNLGNGTLENAVAEAKAVAAATRQPLYFEIGNEPDLFPRHQVHRHADYGYEDYLREYRTFRDGLRKAIPHIAFAGPDAAGATDWVTRFAADERKDIKLLTHHYYREGQNPTSTAEKLLRTDPKLDPILARLKTASESCGVPYRICETNSFSGGGKPGVSDTQTAALWVLDFMFTLASAGCAGVNMETGVNQLGFISSYSPIEDDEKGRYWAAPEYYGMLAFAQAGVGRVIGCTADAGELNLKAYATQPAEKHVFLTLINKENSTEANVIIEPITALPFRGGSVTRLSAPSLESKSGISLGGVSVSPGGTWEPAQAEEIHRNGKGLQLRLVPASAAIVTLHP